MRILICGSRDFTDKKYFDSAIMAELYARKVPFKEITIVHGAARGADTLAHTFAIENNIEVEAHPADWDKFGKSAGFRRNLEMLDSKPVLVIAFFSKKDSRGTQHTVDEANKRGIFTVEYHPYLEK